MTRPTPEQRAADRRGAADVIGAHAVGVPDSGPSMPFTGWSTTGGDLRVPHFVGMHALQALPLFLLALVAPAPRVPRLRDARVRLRLVRVASCSYGMLVALVLWQALRGQPLIHPDGATLAAAAVLAAATAAGTYAALRPGRKGTPGPDGRAVDGPTVRRTSGTSGTCASTAPPRPGRAAAVRRNG